MVTHQLGFALLFLCGLLWALGIVISSFEGNLSWSWYDIGMPIALAACAYGFWQHRKK